MARLLTALLAVTLPQASWAQISSGVVTVSPAAYVSGTTATSLSFQFRFVTNLNTGDTITITADKAVWAAAATTSCTVFQDPTGINTDLAGAIATIQTSDTSTLVLTVQHLIRANGVQHLITCNSNIGIFTAASDVVTFSILATGNTAQTGIAGWTVPAVIASAGGDPITFNKRGEKIKFWLPLGTSA
ncbi:unnamed protein product [Polarella glacialis]|uniref:Uncharacterized protein n=1 Tax=Polarella glacialis TaxID=89957 RepID=A0A813EPH9_POLGL|nr:unnamed protein product [Polarella glacialis]